MAVRAAREPGRQDRVERIKTPTAAAAPNSWRAHDLEKIRRIWTVLLPAWQNKREAWLLRKRKIRPARGFRPPKKCCLSDLILCTLHILVEQIVRRFIEVRKSCRPAFRKKRPPRFQSNKLLRFRFGLLREGKTGRSTDTPSPLHSLGDARTRERGDRPSSDTCSALLPIARAEGCRWGESAGEGGEKDWLDKKREHLLGPTTFF